MKFSLLCMAFFACTLLACNNSTSNEHGTHTHSDGTVHQQHDTATVNQEEFIILKDSTRKSEPIKDSTSKVHRHGNGATHKH